MERAEFLCGLLVDMLEGSGGSLEALDAQALEIVAGSLDFGFSLVDAGEDLGEDTAEYVVALGIRSVWCRSDGLDRVKNELLVVLAHTRKKHSDGDLRCHLYL